MTMKIYKNKTRQEIIDILIEEQLNNHEYYSNLEYLGEILEFGFIGYSKMNDDELIAEYEEMIAHNPCYDEEEE